MANGNFAGGDGTPENPYLIEDAFDLDAMRNNLTASYKLISDIDLDIAPFNEGEGWLPIGDNSTNSTISRFAGSFDGNNKVIFNLFINRPDSNYQGLFGFTNGSTIENVGVENIDITGDSWTGGLVGYNYNSSVIVNSYSTGNITGGSRTGGLVGNNTNLSVVRNSYSTGNVTGSERTGGLVGLNYRSSVIRNSYSTGNVTGNRQTGGLVGNNDSSSVINSYWDKETSDYTTSSGGIGLTTKEMQTAQTFINSGWHEETLEDGTSVWILRDGEYPKLWFDVTRYYSSEGQWESPIIDLGIGFNEIKDILIEKLTNSQQEDVKVYIKTSSNGEDFTSYEEFDGLQLPQDRYIQFKIELSSEGMSLEEVSSLFDQMDQLTKVKLNEYTKAAEDKVQLKTEYLNDLEVDPTWTEEGTLLRKTLRKSEFKKLNEVSLIEIDNLNSKSSVLSDHESYFLTDNKSTIIHQIELPSQKEFNKFDTEEKINLQQSIDKIISPMTYKEQIGEKYLYNGNFYVSKFPVNNVSINTSTLYKYEKYNSSEEWSSQRTINHGRQTRSRIGGRTSYSYSAANGYALSGNTTSSGGYYQVSNQKDRRSIRHRRHVTALGSGISYEHTELYRTRSESRGDYIEDIIGKIEDFPSNGIHSDGFWYVRKEIFPTERFLVIYKDLYLTFSNQSWVSVDSYDLEESLNEYGFEDVKLIPLKKWEEVSDDGVISFIMSSVLKKDYYIESNIEETSFIDILDDEFDLLTWTEEENESEETETASLVMQEDSVLGEGKVYKASIDLSQYQYGIKGISKIDGGE